MNQESQVSRRSFGIGLLILSVLLLALQFYASMSRTTADSGREVSYILLFGPYALVLVSLWLVFGRASAPSGGIRRWLLVFAGSTGLAGAFLVSSAVICLYLLGYERAQGFLANAHWILLGAFVVSAPLVHRYLR